MKAAILHGRENIQIEDIASPPLKPGEIRVRVEAALTCGTDLKVFKRGYHAKMIVPPAIFGHELAGLISEVAPPHPDPLPRFAAEREKNQEAPGDFPSPRPSGEKVVPPRRDRMRGFDWKIGDRVVAANSAPCGECFHCRCGQENLCEDLLFLNGAYAESIVIPARLVQKNLLRLKPETDFRDAALVEPLACAVQGVADTKLSAGQNVLVIGAGPIGLMFVTLAKNLGCNVTVAGRRTIRLAAAQRLGAEQVIDIGDGRELVAKVHQATRTPFDTVLEAVGRPETWEAAVPLVRTGGTVNFFGGCPSGTKVSFDTELIHYSNLTLLASFHHTPRAIRQALDLIEAGVIRAQDFVDGECPLSRLPELFKKMAAGNHAIKTLVRVHE
ncbi:MAG TPA: zinc-binding dehydrogenase [Verrucomicrobiae bacterium]|nr:zinc-binding dehydrogenase [Verrucomicrobiae bacterium]